MIENDPYTLTLCLIRFIYVVLMTSQSVTDDITKALHDNNCDMSTWKMISNFLDIDIIHTLIHPWSRKKVIRVTPRVQKSMDIHWPIHITGWQFRLITRRSGAGAPFTTMD